MDAAALAAKRVGTTLKGKYYLEELIAVGGMAAVYRGSHRNGNRVAVKILHASVCQQTDARDRFSREGCVANKVDHDGAVRVLDDDTTEDGSVFLVMELLEGETLHHRWNRMGKRLPYREVADIGVRLLDVLAAAHNQGIVHRDVKPENLFLTRQGTLKVLDFGIARLRDLTGSGTPSVTGMGHMLGTPAFMPPEQAAGRSQDISGQTDLWAVGATMFALISGKHVHEAESIAELLACAGIRPARPLSSVAPDVPAAIASVVDRALAFEKANRWPNARSMQAALEAALEQAEESPFRTVTEVLFPSVTEVLSWAPGRSLASVAPTVRSLPAPPGPSTTGGLAGLKVAPVVGLERLRGNWRVVIAGAVAMVVAVIGLAFGLQSREKPQARSTAVAAPVVARPPPIETDRAREAATWSPSVSPSTIPAVAAESLPVARPFAVSGRTSRSSVAAAHSAALPPEAHEDNPYVNNSSGAAAPKSTAIPVIDDRHEVNPYLYRAASPTMPADSGDRAR